MIGIKSISNRLKILARSRTILSERSSWARTTIVSFKESTWRAADKSGSRVKAPLHITHQQIHPKIIASLPLRWRDIHQGKIFSSSMTILVYPQPPSIRQLIEFKGQRRQPSGRREDLPTLAVPMQIKEMQR